MHRNNCENLNPERPLPPVWIGTWTTASGHVIEGRFDFAAYERLLLVRAGLSA